MRPDVQPLPAGARRAVRRYDAVTGIIGLLLVCGPLAAYLLVFGRQAVESAQTPVAWRVAIVGLIALGMPAWFGWRSLRFGRACPCPRCGGRLRPERPGQRGTTLLVCRFCGA